MKQKVKRKLKKIQKVSEKSGRERKNLEADPRENVAGIIVTDYQILLVTNR